MGYTFYHHPDLRVPIGGCPEATSTALGDWYAARLNIGWHRLVICVSSNGLIPVITTARSPGQLPRRLAAGVERLLRRRGVAEATIADEMEAMRCCAGVPEMAPPGMIEAAHDYSWAARDMLRAAAEPITFDDIAARLVPAGARVNGLSALLRR